MKIGIDVDGVMADTLHAILTQLNPAWDITKGWQGGLSKEEYAEVWNKAKSIRNFWAHLNTVSTIDQETVELLSVALMWHDVWFITNRFETVGTSPMKQTKYWLYGHMNVQSPNVIVAEKKGPVAVVLKLDAFIDDNQVNCIDVLTAQPGVKVYLHTLPHNQEFNDPRIPRVKNLKEFLKLILEEI